MRNNILTCDWLVKDLETNKDWLFKLDEKDQDEIAEATKFSLKSGKNLFEITDKDFPIHDLLIKIKHIQHQLLHAFSLGFVDRHGVYYFFEQDFPMSYSELLVSLEIPVPRPIQMTPSKN